MSAHCLYRFWGPDQALLYVGITSDPGRRWLQHRKDKPWWTEIANITVQTYPDRMSVLEAKEKAIREEQPAYNIVYNRDGQRSVIRKDSEEPQPAEPTGLAGLYFISYRRRGQTEITGNCIHSHSAYHGWISTDLGEGYYLADSSGGPPGVAGAVIKHISEMSTWKFFTYEDDWDHHGQMDQQVWSNCLANLQAYQQETVSDRF